jgi:hypothetical protein
LLALTSGYLHLTASSRRGAGQYPNGVLQR